MAVEDLVIRSRDLSEILRRFAKYLEDGRVESIRITQDYYWDIPKAIRYDPLATPQADDLTLGQLTYDWERLLVLLEEDRPPIRVALNWLSTILIAIADDEKNPII